MDHRRRAVPRDHGHLDHRCRSARHPAALGFSQADLSWVLNAYVIAFGGLLLLGGKLSDVYGPRRLFSVGFALLLGGSLVAGLANLVLLASIGVDCTDVVR